MNKTTDKILAIYKDNEIYRLVIGNNFDKYELILERIMDSDSAVINMCSLTNDNDMDKERLNDTIDLIHNFFEREMRYANKTLIVRVNCSDQKYLNIKGKLDNKSYEHVFLSKLTGKEDFEPMYTLKHKKFYEDDNNFFFAYEDHYLRNHRYYRLQREDQLTWDEYFMALSKLTSMRSKDPNTQVGACIVGKDHKILSIGYNGAPRGIDDDYFPWARTGNELHTKYMYVCHAEMNAISNYNGPRSDFDGSTIYVDLFPCNECAKLIIQAGIKNVIYLSDKYNNTPGNIAAKKLFDLAGVTYKPLEEEHQKTITLSLNPKDK